MNAGTRCISTEPQGGTDRAVVGSGLRRPNAAGLNSIRQRNTPVATHSSSVPDSLARVVIRTGRRTTATAGDTPRSATGPSGLRCSPHPIHNRLSTDCGTYVTSFGAVAYCGRPVGR